MDYIGEVITSREAATRPDTYLFDLDFNNAREAQYTVDALQYGNASHFVNHSCDPNLVVVPVWVDNLDLSMPRLSFFAAREIKSREELTFDYNVQVRTVEDQSSNQPADQIESFPCHCGASICRGAFF